LSLDPCHAKDQFAGRDYSCRKNPRGMRIITNKKNGEKSMGAKIEMSMGMSTETKKTSEELEQEARSLPPQLLARIKEGLEQAGLDCEYT
jgi:hypothetical protein